MPVKADGSVREIMNDTNAVLLRKTDRLLEKRLCRHSAGRIIRIIEIQQLRLAPHLFRNYTVIRRNPLSSVSGIISIFAFARATPDQ